HRTHPASRRPLQGEATDKRRGEEMVAFRVSRLSFSSSWFMVSAFRCILTGPNSYHSLSSVVSGGLDFSNPLVLRYFLRKLKKVKKSNGQVLAINEVDSFFASVVSLYCSCVRFFCFQ
ncbi:hypothetical protein BHE74_00020186, partial [Ensete ventricosum]